MIMINELCTFGNLMPCIIIATKNPRYPYFRAVTGCSHVIHTSRFQDDKPAKEDDVTTLLQECKVGGIQQVVLTGGQEEISGTKHLYLIWSIRSDSILILTFTFQESDRSFLVGLYFIRFKHECVFLSAS